MRWPSWWSRRGRPPLERERIRVGVMMDAEVHGHMLDLVGRTGHSQTDVVHAALLIGLPMLEVNPEFIPTLIDKLTASAKKDPE